MVGHNLDYSTFILFVISTRFIFVSARPPGNKCGSLRGQFRGAEFVCEKPPEAVISKVDI